MSPSEDQAAELRRQDGGRLTEELQALQSRSTQELKQAWQTLLGTQPPNRLSRDLLIRTEITTAILDGDTGDHHAAARAS